MHFVFFQCQYNTLKEALAMFLFMLFIGAEKRRSALYGPLEYKNHRFLGMVSVFDLMHFRPWQAQSGGFLRKFPNSIGFHLNKAI